MFLERLSKLGIDTSPYYKKGGVFNTYKEDNQMPSCTPYCMLRTYEATDATTPYPIAQKNLGFDNAKNWYKNTPLAKGSELKVGSIAVFDGTMGHVAFVERRLDNTHALISQSQYDKNKSLRNDKYFETKEVELVVGKATLNGIGKLLGFIYTPITDKRVKRNLDKEQINITSELVNVRATPNGKIYREGCYAPMGIYNVLDKEIVDGYTWYEIDKGCYVREGDWITHYDLSNELQKENEELKERLRKIKELCEV